MLAVKFGRHTVDNYLNVFWHTGDDGLNVFFGSKVWHTGDGVLNVFSAERGSGGSVWIPCGAAVSDLCGEDSEGPRPPGAARHQGWPDCAPGHQDYQQGQLL